MSLELRPLTVTNIVQETKDAYTIHFEKPGSDSWQYLPGQFITLEVQIQGETHRRAFSLSSSPYIDPDLSVTIKQIPNGLVSGFLKEQVNIGDKLLALPPAGNFILPTDPTHRRHYLLIGAGSGITPLMSMLKSVLAAEPESKVSLWYGNRGERDIIFKEELIRLKGVYLDRLSVIHVLSRPTPDWKGLTGRLNKEVVYELIMDLFMVDEYKKRYYICGPEGMMEEVRKAMDKHAIDPSHVFQEYYHTPLDTLLASTAPSMLLPEQDPLPPSFSQESHQVKIRIDGENHQITVPAGQTILDAGLEHGLALPYSCKGGICTTCKAKCISGEVGMKVDLGLSQQDKAEGFVLTCQSYPLEDEVEVVYR